MNDCRILIVRHPETEANTTGRFVGRGDSPYTELGRVQARRLPEEIAAFEADRVWSSPLRRAVEVARDASDRFSVELVVDERLSELDFGEAEGMTWEEIAEAGLRFDYRSMDEPVAPGGESRAAIAARSAEIADEIVSAGGRQAIVTHGGVMRSMLIHLLGLGSNDIWAFHLRNAQIAEIHVIEGHGMLEEFRLG